jgi:hypothetical protein
MPSPTRGEGEHGKRRLGNMTSPLLAFLLKLPLALFVFLLIAYAGTANRRIAGVLFTFPILNGVAIIASTDPNVVADAIYPLVIFNCVLFAFAISFPQALPVSALPRGPRLLARVTIWSAAWFAGAYCLTDFRAAISGAGVLFAGSFAFAILFVLLFWTRDTSSDAQSNNRAGRGFAQRHWTGFTAFWLNRTGAGRIVFFTLAYACLFFASRVALDEKWVGMASALPLPGFFALASLIDDAEHSDAPHAGLRALLSIRDTLFLGPVLVIPFNWAFSHLLVFGLPPDAIVLRYLLLFALWTVAALAVLLFIPRLAAHFDRRS